MALENERNRRPHTWRALCNAAAASMYFTGRLQESMSRARYALSETIQTVSAMSGLSLARPEPVRVLVSLGSVTAGALWLSMADEISIRVGILCFLLSLTLRYGFLFASFPATGIAPWLKERFGAERGFSMHESAQNVLLFVQRLSFGALLFGTAQSASGPMGTALVALGVLLVVIGVGVSVWAARVVGVDTYHYRDLFMGPRHISVERQGPYAVFANPMYGPGQLATYGLALIALSPIGLVAAVLHQLLLYVFNHRVEQPHLRSANSIMLETELRFALARTVRSIVPRGGLGVGRDAGAARSLQHGSLAREQRGLLRAFGCFDDRDRTRARASGRARSCCLFAIPDLQGGAP